MRIVQMSHQEYATGCLGGSVSHTHTPHIVFVTRFNSLLYILGREYGYLDLRPIHRLDRLTSGTKCSKTIAQFVLMKYTAKRFVYLYYN